MPTPPAEAARPRSVVDLLDRAAGFPDHGLRLLDASGAARFLSWTEIRRRARSAAVDLRERGVGPGDRVALILPTCAGTCRAIRQAWALRSASWRICRWSRC